MAYVKKDLITCKRWKKLQHLLISRQAKLKLSIDEIALVVEDFQFKAPAHLTISGSDG